MTVEELDLATRDQVNARRNFIAGLWAGQRLGVPSAELSDYVQSVMDSDYLKPGCSNVVSKLKGDFDRIGKSISESELTSRLIHIEHNVRAELLCTD